MNKPNPITLAALGLLLAGAAHAQAPRAKIDLARVRSTFNAADKDKSGALDAREIKAAGIPEKDFQGQDVDKDKLLSGDEFVTYYRQLLVRAGRTVNADIETEVARIQAARRTQEAKDAAKKDAREAPGKKPKPAPSGPSAGRRGSTSDRLERAKAALNGKRDDVRVEQATGEGANVARSQAERVQAARDKQTAERVQAARDAQTAKRVQDARDAAKAEQAQDAPQLTPEQRAAKLRDEKAASDAQRAADMRAKLANEQAASKGSDEKSEQQPAAGETPARRAQQYVKRLVDQGRLSAERARDFYTLLNAEPEAAGQKAAGPGELRAALKRAKPRIGELVEKGFLTAAEGRELSTALDARATAAAKAEPAKESPATPQRGETEGGETEGREGGPADARRAGQKSDGKLRDARTEAGEGKRKPADGARPERAPEVKPKRDAVKPQVKERKPKGEARRSGRDG